MVTHKRGTGRDESLQVQKLKKEVRRCSGHLCSGGALDIHAGVLAYGSITEAYRRKVLGDSSLSFLS